MKPIFAELLALTDFPPSELQLPALEKLFQEALASHNPDYNRSDSWEVRHEGNQEEQIIYLVLKTFPELIPTYRNFALSNKGKTNG